MLFLARRDRVGRFVGLLSWSLSGVEVIRLPGSARAGLLLLNKL